MSNIDFTAYIRLEQLPDEVKKRHGGKAGAKIPRFDVTATAGYYKPLEAIKNGKGMVVAYLNETRGIIDSPDQRRADRFLMFSTGHRSRGRQPVWIWQPQQQPQVKERQPQPLLWQQKRWLFVPDCPRLETN